MYTTLSPHHTPVTWIIVADGKEAHFYDYRKVERDVPLGGTTKFHYTQKKSTHALVPIPSGNMEAETINDYQIGHQRRGMSGTSFASQQNTYEPTGNTKEELKRRFVRTIAAKLDRLCYDKAFDRLIIAAPAKIIGELREQLPEAVQKCIVAVLPKELTAYEGQILLSHLEDTLEEAHSA